MDLWSLLSALRNHWRCALLAGLLTAAGGAPGVAAGPAFAQNASIVLQRAGPPALAVDPSRNFVVTGELLAESIVADGERGRLGARRDGVTYRVNIAAYEANLESTGRSYGPLLEVSTFGPTALSTARAFTTLLKAVDARLSAIQSQAGSPPSSFIIVKVIASSAAPVPVYGSPARAAAGLGLLTLGLGLTAASAGDALRRAREARRPRLAS